MAEPLRIGIVVDQFPELSETFIVAEAQELARLGHGVHLESVAHAPHPNESAARGLDVAYLEDDDRARRLTDIAWLAARHPVRCARDLAWRRRLAREERARPLRRLAPAARRLRGRGVTHLHAHFAAEAALDTMRLAALLDVPYSVASHGYDIFQLPRNLREKHERAAFAVSACDYSVGYLRGQLGAPAARRVHRLVTGVDGERFRRRTPHEASGTVLAVGRLVEKKGFAHLIDAAARVDALERVVIVGDGPLREELAERARAAGVETLVELAGPRTPEEIRELLERTALVAVPSVVAADGDRDTMPVIAKEALAMEVPVVASDAMGLPELVQPEWGRLVPPGDAQALAGAIEELLAVPVERRAEMGRAGRAFVLRECSLQRETERLAELIAAAASR
jgi:colanic acid/amylovoran biosynthesis glycosyltransferase